MKKKITIDRKKVVLSFFFSLLLLLAGGLLVSCSLTSPTLSISIVEDTLPFTAVEAEVFNFSTIRIVLEKEDGSTLERPADEMMLSSTDRAKLKQPGTHSIEINFDGCSTKITLSVYPRGKEPSYTLRFFEYPENGLPTEGSLTPIAEFTMLISKEFMANEAPAVPQRSGYTDARWTVTEFSKLRVSTDIYASYSPLNYSLSFSYIDPDSTGTTDAFGQKWKTIYASTRNVGDNIGATPADEHPEIKRYKENYRLIGWKDADASSSSKIYSSTSLFDKDGPLNLKAVYEAIVIDHLELVTLASNGTPKPEDLGTDHYSAEYLEYLKEAYSSTLFREKDFEERKVVGGKTYGTPYNYFNSYDSLTSNESENVGGVFIKAYREYGTDEEEFFYIPLDSQASETRGNSKTHDCIDPITGKKIRVVVETTSLGAGSDRSIFELSERILGADNQYNPWETGKQTRDMKFTYYILEEKETVGSTTTYEDVVRGEFGYTLHRMYTVKVNYVSTQNTTGGEFDFGTGSVEPVKPISTAGKEIAVSAASINSVWLYIYVTDRHRYTMNMVISEGASWLDISSNLITTNNEYNNQQTVAIQLNIKANQKIGDATVKVEFQPKV